jgi:hypothetical protein
VYIDTKKLSTITSPGWVLFVKSAESALEYLCRKLGPTLRDVAMSLVEKGIPFTTRRLLNFLPNVPLPPLHNLGCWNPNYHPDLLDYENYKRRRDAFLL